MTRQLRFDPTKDIESWRLTRFVDGSSISLDSLLRFFLSSSAKDLSVAWIRLAGGLVEYCKCSRNHPSKEATLCWEEGVSLDRVRLDRLRSEQIVRVSGQSFNRCEIVSRRALHSRQRSLTYRYVAQSLSPIPYGTFTEYTVGTQLDSYSGRQLAQRICFRTEYSEDPTPMHSRSDNRRGSSITSSALSCNGRSASGSRNGRGLRGLEVVSAQCTARE